MICSHITTGKKIWYAYGTSITNTDREGKYCCYVDKFSGLIRKNKGISGGGIISNRQLYEAVMNVDDGKESADLITLEVGANDLNAPLGQITDTDTTTFLGTLNCCIRYLQANTTAQIVVMSSPHRRYSKDSNIIYDGTQTFGEDHHTQQDMDEAIRQLCMMNSCYFIGLGNASGLGYARMNASDKYNVDHVHQSNLGGYITAKYMWSILKDIPLFDTTIPHRYQ